MNTPVNSTFTKKWGVRGYTLHGLVIMKNKCTYVTTENVILPENVICVTFSGATEHHRSRKCNTSIFIQQV